MCLVLLQVSDCLGHFHYITPKSSIFFLRYINQLMFQTTQKLKSLGPQVNHCNHLKIIWPMLDLKEMFRFYCSILPRNYLSNLFLFIPLFHHSATFTGINEDCCLTLWFSDILVFGYLSAGTLSSPRMDADHPNMLLIWLCWGIVLGGNINQLFLLTHIELLLLLLALGFTLFFPACSIVSSTPASFYYIPC